ncbi:PREDICTED: methyltransferase-like protein 25 [Atta cephalotes]|uniref:Methyltransferase domain-containing protein n=1 Tax=Atta cephalotes TaxID=12957 RepID=A0A158NU83_ATTCE|nr:PREDICTED: methyltransferase-like protein 25 [Atta cephalotes]XP_018050012.1 PREDICTED: methyltransferase-like protein 25 [Atta colombica]
MMTEYNQHFEKALDFINIYQELIDCHLVDFITEGLWDKCLPEKLRSELENIDMNDDIWAENNIDSELSNFIQLTKSLSLESCSAVICVNDLPKLLPQSSTERLIENKFVYPKSELMNTKKSHEIEMLGKVIAEIALSTHSLVIDAGAGKAYLSTYLSEHFNIPILAIDSSQVCYKGAINRQEKIQKRKRTLTKIRYIVQELDDTTNYNKVVNTCYPDWNVNGNLILTGLHTCGMLVHSVIKAFLHAKDINLLLVVPCCYHLANETLSGCWNFSKNARMLAQQSIERSRYNKHLSPSLFYRAVLQIILHSLGYYNAKVGRGGPLNNFVDYAKCALSKIGVDKNQIPSAYVLQEIYQNHIHFKSRLSLFQMLRIYMSSVVEAAIMLDRIIFLQNNIKCSKVAVIRLFDPTLSPRCYGIIATK